MPSSSSGSATNANVSRIAEFRVSADEPASILPINTVISCRTDLFSPSHRIAGGDIPARYLEAPLMESRNTIEKPNVRNAPSSPDLYATCVRSAPINITCDQLEQWTAANEQSFDEQLYCSDIERVSPVNNSRVPSSFLANQQSIFQVLSSLLCDIFGLANCLGAFFVDVLVR